MNPVDFDYALPPELIAQQPLPERSASRLLALDPGGALQDLHFSDIAGLLRAGDLLVVNESRVIPARVFGHKRSGGQCEFLLERLLDDRTALAQLRASHAPKPGSWLDFPHDFAAELIERRDAFYVLRFSRPVMALLEAAGHMPLPPYIRRADDSGDRERYQTLFAREPGSVAAPTAGLHFDATLLARLAQAGVGLTRVRLHVGAGTFAPLREAQLQSGRLHAERVSIGADTVVGHRGDTRRWRSGDRRGHDGGALSGVGGVIRCARCLRR